MPAESIVTVQDSGTTVFPYCIPQEQKHNLLHGENYVYIYFYEGRIEDWKLVTISQQTRLDDQVDCTYQKGNRIHDITVARERLYIYSVGLVGAVERIVKFQNLASKYQGELQELIGSKHLYENANGSFVPAFLTEIQQEAMGEKANLKETLSNVIHARFQDDGE